MPLSLPLILFFLFFSLSSSTLFHLNVKFETSFSFSPAQKIKNCLKMNNVYHRAAPHSPQEVQSVQHLSCFSLGVLKSCREEETDEEWRKEKETKRGLVSGGNDGRVGEKVRQMEGEGISRLGERKEIEESQKMEALWQRWCVDGGWTGSLSCGSGMGLDRVISHVEIYPGTFQWWKDESERPFFTCHEYLFGESVHRLLRGMTNGGQLSIFYSHLFPRPLPPVTDSSNQWVCFHLVVYGTFR